MTAREAKESLYAQFSRIAKATSSPRRIELLELLAQAERSVEELAQITGMEVGNTSAQLRVLSGARLVTSRRLGKRVLYRLGDLQVSEFLAALRALARARLAEVESVERAYFDPRDELEPVTFAELRDRTERGRAILLDVRPAEEYEAGHIPGAHCMPLSELEAGLSELPRDMEIVAYCRGPYCVLAPQAVEMLRRAAFNARRLAEGFPEWRLAGLPTAVAP